ncbi:MAG: hypothetical protein GC165_18285 [Armatimonadetes bacterium]|nr:hypothetical protein [Armatimonadota bacterium]
MDVENIAASEEKRLEENVMTKSEYRSWLEERLSRTQASMEVTPRLGLAGEIGVSTFEQSDVNAIAARQTSLLEDELSRLQSVSPVSDYSLRKADLAERLDSVKVNDEN